MSRPPARPVRWGRVEGHAEAVLIVAGGPSAAAVNVKALEVPAGVALIAVNGVGRLLPQATHWTTIDPSTENRQIMESARVRPATRFYAGVYPHYEPTETEDRHVVFLQRRLGNGPRKACFGLDDDPGWISTGNSAYAALGVAWHLGCRRIGFLGLDGTLEDYWWGKGRPRGSFSHLPSLFASAVAQLRERGVEVMNGSPRSVIDCYPRVQPHEVVTWLCRAGEERATA